MASPPSYPAHDNISPAPQHQAYSPPPNEKANYMHDPNQQHPQQQQHFSPQQGQFQQQHPQQGQYPQQYPQQGQLQHHPSQHGQVPQPGQPMPGNVAPGQGFQTAIPIQSLSLGPAPIDCPSCGMRQMTRCEYQDGNTTYAWALGLCLICVCLAFIPFCTDSFKDVIHYCGHCGVRVATVHRSGRVDQHVHR